MRAGSLFIEFKFLLQAINGGGGLSEWMSGLVRGGEAHGEAIVHLGLASQNTFP